jgi:hypothetical protein
MLMSFGLKGSLLIVMMALCMCVPIVNAEDVVVLSWTSPTNADLRSVYMLDSTDGWAVGSLGTIIHWNGSEWNNVTNPTTNWLSSVHMVSASDGWAVGWDRIIHWNGSEWNNVTNPTTKLVSSVYMVSTDDGWAVGSMTKIHDMIVIGGGIIHWNGSAWSDATVKVSEDWEVWGLEAVFMVNATDGWAVGWAVVGGIPLVYHGRMFHWDGAEWSNVTIPTLYPLKNVFMVNTNDGWAVGDSGTIIHWNGTTWSNMTSPTLDNLHSVSMVSANDGWIVGGNGTILHWDGAEWRTVTSPTEQDLSDVFMVSADDGWAVGAHGTIIQWTGIEWIPEFPSFLILSLSMIPTLLAVTVYRRRRPLWILLSAFIFHSGFTRALSE